MLQRELAARRAVGRVDVEPKYSIAWFHMIEMSINLINVSTVTVFMVSEPGSVWNVTQVGYRILSYWYTQIPYWLFGGHFQRNIQTENTG